MCLGAPGQIVRFIDETVVECDFWGMTREVQLDLLEGDLAVGDYILEHEGHAVLTEAGEDPIATEASCAMV